MGANDINFETQLYPPVKRLLEKMGYTVRSEVKSCDIVAIKDEHIIVVEMKKTFNMTLLYQAMDRKTITNDVYVAIPRPANYRNKNTRMMLKVLKGLGIGLIAVGVKGIKKAEIISEPEKKATNVNSRKRAWVKKEAVQRSADRNIGGSTRTKLITAYREASVLALCHMEEFDTLNTAYLKKLGYMEKVRNALKSNAYGWFEKVGRGTYAMSEVGIKALYEDENKELVEYYRKEVNKNV